MKTNHFFLLAAATLIAAGCSVKERRSECLAPVNVHVNDFSVSQLDYPGTKTTSTVAAYNEVGAITLAFYTSAGAEQYKVTQLRSTPAAYTTFGDFSLSLPMGSYTMVVIAHTTKETSPFVLTSPTEAAYTGDHAYETFAYTQAVEISSTSAVELSATLERINAMLKIISSDGKTANANQVRMTLSAGARDFSPTSGLSLTNYGFVNTVGFSATVGNSSTSSTAFFLATDEQTMNVTIDVLDSDGNSVSHRVVSDVPFKRNRITQLSGSLYTNDGVSSSFQLSTDWLTTYSDTF